ncbi:MOSC domain-containing protein [Nocardioides sp.]|uniref:MOSC domain-containing protein n=1 Tax=Nocardioides sp. TaxID=35761 RepID=UPI0035634487
MSIGVITHLHIAKATRLPMRAVDAAEIQTARGIIGDRYHGSRHRQVSIQSLQDLQDAGRQFGAPIAPWLTRRNITVSGTAVPRTPGAIIVVGDILLEVVRVAAPCKLLDDVIGAGAQEALRHRGGSICRVIDGGPVEIGTPVAVCTEQAVRPLRFVTRMADA